MDRRSDAFIVKGFVYLLMFVPSLVFCTDYSTLNRYQEGAFSTLTDEKITSVTASVQQTGEYGRMRPFLGMAVDAGGQVRLDKFVPYAFQVPSEKCTNLENASGAENKAKCKSNALEYKIAINCPYSDCDSADEFIGFRCLARYKREGAQEEDFDNCEKFIVGTSYTKNTFKWGVQIGTSCSGVTLSEHTFDYETFYTPIYVESGATNGDSVTICARLEKLNYDDNGNVIEVGEPTDTGILQKLTWTMPVSR
jgi:hypothetical protein